MKLLTLSLALAASMGLSGCASSSHILTGVARPAISPNQVRIFSSPPKKFEEIAVLTSESEGWTSQGETDLAIARLKKEAARLGANGVLLVGRGTVSSGIVGAVNPKTGAIWAGESTSTKMEARAILVIEL